MNFNPMVSIVIPCYNHAQFVRESIQSVIDQDYENIELIIIDDGSKDNSVEVIQEMILACEERFKRFEFRYRPNKGLCATLNEALDWCEGVFFAPIASDDVLLPDKTSFQVRLLTSTSYLNVVAAFGLVESFTREKNRNKREIVYYEEVYCFEDIFLRKSKLAAPSAMIVTKKVKDVLGYNESFKVEDFYLWLKLTTDNSNILYSNKLMSFYRRHEDNLSKKDTIMINGVIDVLKEYSDHPKYNEAVSRSLFVHAGDLIQERKISALSYLLKALLKKPQLLFSKLFFVFFYRGFIGFVGKL